MAQLIYTFGYLWLALIVTICTRLVVISNKVKHKQAALDMFRLVAFLLFYYIGQVIFLN